MNIGIVCGYGMITDARLQRYLDEVSRYASKRKLDALILSGGCTLKDAEESEARVMWRAMQADISDFQLFFEEESISTLHNLLYSARLIKKETIPVEKLYIFCDTLRFLKVWCLSKLIFRAYPTQIVMFQRKEPFGMYLLQIPFTVLQCLGAVCPPVEKIILNVRLSVRKSLQKDRS